MSFSSTLPIHSRVTSLLSGLKSSEQNPVEATNTGSAVPIIAICHLQWDWVWQRPQQFLSRLARTHPVLFVETHATETPHSYTLTRSARNHPAVTIIEVHLPAARWSDGNYIDGERRRVLQGRLEGEFNGRFNEALLWFNDPMAVTAYAGHLGEKAIVYDCMDELTQFQDAPAALVEREKELTKRADLIFCGGRKMRAKRLPLNANTHFYGTGVDCAHFGRALSPDLAIDPDVAGLRGPTLGYFGVIDERIDYTLLAALADAEPDWNVVMVGPVAKVDPRSLPQRPNLHWLGGRPYDRLPALTKRFDVCLMPFALNSATEYINPTKALEYMAAGRPVVSTALDEVRSNFATVAQIADTHAEFVALCRSEVESPLRVRLQRGLQLAAANTWDAIVLQMENHLEKLNVAPTSLPATEVAATPRRKVNAPTLSRPLYV